MNIPDGVRHVKHVRRPNAPGRALGTLLLSMALFMMGLAAIEAHPQAASGPPGHVQPPHAPMAAMECLEEYFRGVSRCRQAFCTTLFGFFLGCDDFLLEKCQDISQCLFDLCIGAESCD